MTRRPDRYIELRQSAKGQKRVSGTPSMRTRHGIAIGPPWTFGRALWSRMSEFDLHSPEFWGRIFTPGTYRVTFASEVPPMRTKRTSKLSGHTFHTRARRSHSQCATPPRHHRGHVASAARPRGHAPWAEGQIAGFVRSEPAKALTQSPEYS